jgi:hypothetical protein
LSSEDATDIGIDDSNISFVGKRQYRSSGIRTEPGQRKQRIEVAGHHSPMLLNNSNRSPMKIHCTTVVTEACPLGNDVANGSLRANRRRRESLEELVPTRNNSRHLCLLEHQFRNKYRPRVACLPPGQLVATASGPRKYRLDVRRSEHESVF